jgi:hypothetical protein
MIYQWPTLQAEGWFDLNIAAVLLLLALDTSSRSQCQALARGAYRD